MRLFFAVPVPISKALHELHGGLDSLSGDLKPVRPELIHITLKFLGEVSIPPDLLSNSANSILSDLDPFPMKISGSGAFPDWRRPSVLWLSVNDEDKMSEIASRLSRVLQKDHGIPPDRRPFRSHITVARVRRNGRINSGRARDLLENCVTSLTREGYEIRVDGFRLISSRLTPLGPVYTEVDSYGF
ncbi:MAG: RNA 2',3'-cyclic phosphodiesterase [Thermoplasmatota archaeon]